MLIGGSIKSRILVDKNVHLVDTINNQPLSCSSYQPICSTRNKSLVAIPMRAHMNLIQKMSNSYRLISNPFNHAANEDEVNFEAAFRY
jgi:hypothetical protein